MSRSRLGRLLSAVAILLALSAPSASGQENAHAGWVGADVEGLDQVHTQVEQNTAQLGKSKSRSPYESLIRHQGVCVEEVGQSSWIGQIPGGLGRTLLNKHTTTRG